MSKAYFWSLFITSQVTSVCLWSRDDDATQVVLYGPEVAWSTEEELVAAVDTSLTHITAHIPEDAGEPEKTVFGVPNAWVTEGHIKKEYLSLIRDICGKLSLSPVGFVVIPEAISHEVKQNEGGPLSAVVIGIAKNSLEVTLFRLGTPAGTLEVGRSVSIMDDLVDALTRFQANEAFPSRFIVYGVADTELVDVIHTLGAATWKDVEKLHFLHEPKVEQAGHERLLAAISLAGSSEMGPVRSFKTPKHIRAEDQNLVPTDMTVNDLGFAIDADIAKIKPKHEPLTAVADAEEVEDEELEAAPLHATRASALFSAKQKVAHLFGARNPITKLLSKRSAHSVLPVERPHAPLHVHKSRRFTPKQILTLGGAGVLVIILGMFGALYFLPKAEITIYISPRTLTTHETFTLSESASGTNVENKTLPVSVFKKTVSGEDSAPASGTKTVGDKAKGSVTIRNGTANGVRLPSGALLVTSSNLQFVIDQTASVSAATSPTTPGTVTVAATANAIGAEYNLEKDQTLKVGNFLTSEIDAVVNETFSGGSSRQITAVSKADLDSLKESLTNKLTAQAKEDIVQEVPSDYQFIPDLVTTVANSQSFDRKVGDEASTINLSMEIDATSYAIPKQSLTDTAQALLASQVPDGYSFRPEQVETNFTIQNASQLLADIGLTAHLLPNVNPDDVARAVAGKRLTAANNYLGTIPGFVRATITSKPALPSAIRFVPFLSRNIQVSIEAER